MTLLLSLAGCCLLFAPDAPDVPPVDEDTHAPVDTGEPPDTDPLLFDPWVTHSLADAEVRLTGAGSGDRLGYAVSAGDIDGDGAIDLVVGAPGHDALEVSAAGAAYVAWGPVLGGARTVTDGAVAVLGAEVESRLGYAVAGGGDADGDGRDDLLLGLPGLDGRAGAVALVAGATLGASDLGVGGATALWRAGAADTYAGGEVAWVGDVDGDGLADALVGGWGAAEDAGSAWLVLGAGLVGEGSLADADVAWVGEAPGDHLGSALAGLGDLDGDGLDEVVVGAPDAMAAAGRVYVLGGGAATVGDAWATLTGLAPGDWAGDAVAAAGDVDGDGLPDLLVGATGEDGGGVDAGAARLVTGAALAGGGDVSLADAGVVAVGATGEDYAGFALGAGGDPDDDGTPDLLVGAPNFDPLGSEDRGRMAVVAVDRVRGDPIDTPSGFEGDEDRSYAGWRVLGPGDLDGEPGDDVVVSAPWASASGAVYVVSGR
ncbi:MAG: integrin alpha [Pseudomonadota bacterium]|nr:integrin alpha [Pseudomonadota bacterium]